MEGFPVAALLSRSVQDRTTRSALPDAPVVPDRPMRRGRPGPDPRAPRAARSRTVLARVLARAAEAVAPAPSTPSPRC